jgi:hypothetical protein
MPVLKKTLASKKAGGGGALAKARERASQRANGAGKLEDSALKKLVPSGMAHSFVSSKLHDKAIAVAGLGEPANWDGEMPELPDDIATLDHDMLSNLYAAFTNAHSTAIWYASKSYVEADAYEEIAEYLENIALLDTSESNESKRKAAARTDERVVAASALQHQHYRDYVRFRDLAITLDKKARAVSRIGGFISEEAEHEETRASKASTRGRSAGSARGNSRGELRRKPRR